jgi:hypothetical protein
MKNMTKGNSTTCAMNLVSSSKLILETRVLGNYLVLENHPCTPEFYTYTIDC